MNLKQLAVVFATLVTAGIAAITIGTMLINSTRAQPAGDPVPHYLPACAAEDGGPELPCIWHKPTADGRYILFTAS